MAGTVEEQVKVQPKPTSVFWSLEANNCRSPMVLPLRFLVLYFKKVDLQVILGAGVDEHILQKVLNIMSE